MARPVVSFITVNYNQRELTLAMLRSIYRTVAGLSFEVIVVDNASREDPAPAIRAEFPDVICLQAGGNIGFAAANNLGIRRASGQYLFFVNNDTELTPGLTEGLVDFLSRTPDAGAVSPLICYFPETEKGQADVIQYAGTTPVHMLTGRNRTIGAGETDTGQYRGVRETAYAHGAAMMVPKTVIKQIGPWPENFFLYYEELDWCAHMRRAGLKIYVLGDVKIYHKESVTIGQDSPLKLFYLNRNRILFMRRNYAGVRLWPFVVFLCLVTVPKNLLLYTLRGRPALRKAFWRAVWWHVAPRQVGDPYLPG